MSQQAESNTRKLLGAFLGLILFGVVAVGGLVGYSQLVDDGSGPNRSAPVSTASDQPYPTPNATSSPSTVPPPSPSATPSGSASSSASASPTAVDTGPGSRTYVPELQEAAERATSGNSNAALVALDIHTGEIVAVVNRGPGMSGLTPPGSTFKIVSSALLLKKGVVTPDKKVPCPKTAIAGQAFHNLDNFEIPNATFRQDFARSCNTAFVNLRSEIGDSELSTFASEYFGLNSESWQVGEGGTTDGRVPPSRGDADKAAQMIGQGSLQMNAMTMASVVATAVTGKFHQPILVRGGDVHRTSKALPQNVVSGIKDMMRACATNGTAASTFQGMSGVGAKTGTAEVGNGTDGWMVAYRGDIAVAVVVEGGSSGSGSAGPIVRSFLSAVRA
ncbi:penicillin-binding transpeptidase domain-containing protein [Yinghuangia sp. YIM S09857]|uniref:penicillin-binding transpeptidase domain-containing protein n=1 Tax=Yinghuangia sp. YIM S09857 TaxID=3436929 RepID=UPI003F538306